MGRIEQGTGSVEIRPNILKLAKQRNIEVNMGWPMSETREQLLTSTVIYLGRFSDIFSDEFEGMFTNDPTNKHKDSRGLILQHLRTNDLFRPDICVMDYKVAKGFLATHKIRDPHESDKRDWSNMTPEIFVNFELPKTLSYWWAKGTGDWGNRGKDLDDMVIEWGRYYREIMPLVWKKMRVGVWSKNERLYVERLNEVETHVAGEYYNVYVVRKMEGNRPVWPPKSPLQVAYERANRLKKQMEKK